MAVVLRARSEGAPALAASNGARARHGLAVFRHDRSLFLVLPRSVVVCFHPLCSLGVGQYLALDLCGCCSALGCESSGTGARRARAATKAWGGCGGRRGGGGGARVRPARGEGEAGAARGAASGGGGGQSGQGREAARGGAPGGGEGGGGGRGQPADGQGARCGGEPSCAGGAGRRRGAQCARSGGGGWARRLRRRLCGGAAFAAGLGPRRRQASPLRGGCEGGDGRGVQLAEVRAPGRIAATRLLRRATCGLHRDGAHARRLAR